MSLSSLLARAHPLIESRLGNTADTSFTLFFSLSDGKTRATVYRGFGPTLQRAWLDGVSRCQREAQRKELAVCWLRIDWVTDIQASTWGDLSGRLARTKRNYFRVGLSLDAGLNYAFLEQELCANAMLYPGASRPEAGLNEKNFTVYAKRRFGQNVPLDFSPGQPVFLFSHDGLFLADDASVSALPGGEASVWLPGAGKADIRWRDAAALNASRRQIEILDQKSVYALIDSSANFLARQVKPTGQFIYGHFPCFGREIPTYNSLRHASSVYSMLEGWELTKDETLLDAIRRALAYLTSTLIRRYPQPDGTVVSYNVDVNGEIKLGANAVSLLALVKYDELTGDTQYRPLMEELALGVARMQDTQTGGFVHVLNADDLTLKEAFRIVYYDGEAAFGLMRLYGLTADPRWIEIVEKAFDYFIAAEHWKHHDHWLSYCANELTLHKPEEKYFRFGVQNIAGYLDFILQRETTYPTLLELGMAFDAMLRRIEHEFPHMRHVLDDLDIEKFYRALHHRAHYLLNGFFWPEQAMYFAKPKTISGSFFIRHHTFRVRIDDIEHYLSGYVAYWKMLTRFESEARQQVYKDGISSRSIISGPTVVWGGDVNLGRRQHYRLDELGIEKILQIPALHEAELRIVNLECVIATKGQQGVNKGEGGPYYYRARPEMLRVLAAAGIDVVATANNHSGDYGPEALLEQKRWLDAVGLAFAGSGCNREAAFSPVFRRAGNLNVALFSIDATQYRFAATDDRPGTAYLPLSQPEVWVSELKQRITNAREYAHVVLVAVHWGDNLAPAPVPAEVAVGHALIDAGADAVLGASAHVLQGIEIYQHRPIIYDAGDLLFDSIRKKFGSSGVFRLEISANGVERVVFVPVGVGFGFSEQLSCQAARAATQDYALKCIDFGTRLTFDLNGSGFIDLKPPARPYLSVVPAPTTRWDLEPLALSSLPGNPEWQVEAVPEDARIQPVQFGQLMLLGIRVTPRQIDHRRMLWVESFWCCETPIEENFRLDIRAVPLGATVMRPWGQGMDHEPCDWMVPTSRWQPGVIYRDYYGLRPPYLSDWKNIDLQIAVGTVSCKQASTPVVLPIIVRLAMPGKNINVSLSCSEDSSVTAKHSFSSSELLGLIGGTWAYPPKEEIFIDYFVTGTGLIKSPRTCMVCMDYETWLKGTGNSGHYRNIFSDSHVTFIKKYKKYDVDKKVNFLIVQRPLPEVAHIPQVVVRDSYEALKVLAAAARKKMSDNGVVFAVTGAVGKSTTCDLLAQILNPISNCIAMTNGHNSRTGVMLWAASLGIFDPKFGVDQTRKNTCVLEVAGSALWMRDGWVMKAVRPDIGIITHIELTQYGASSRTIEDVAFFKSRVCEFVRKRSANPILNRTRLC